MFAPAKAIAAAERAADRFGFGAIDPAPLHVSDHVTLRLRSAPMVARVKPALAIATMRREVEIVAYLAKKGAPVVPPSTGAYVEEGCAVSFWQRVPHRAANHTDLRLAAETLGQIHRAFSDYPGELPSWNEKIKGCLALLRDAPLPELSTADRSFLIEVAKQLDVTGHESVPLHGDAGLHNLFITETGALWNDFAAACRGPRGWDAAALGLGASPVLLMLRSFCVSVWCWAQAADPGKWEAANYHLGVLKRRFG